MPNAVMRSETITSKYRLKRNRCDLVQIIELLLLMKALDGQGSKATLCVTYLDVQVDPLTVLSNGC